MAAEVLGRSAATAVYWSERRVRYRYCYPGLIAIMSGMLASRETLPEPAAESCRVCDRRDESVARSSSVRLSDFRSFV